MQMKTNFFWALLLLLVSQVAMAQRFTEKLDRGLVAVPLADKGNDIGTFVSWRRLSNEYFNVTYNLYYNGSLLASNLANTNYTHPHKITGTEKYQVAAVVNGVMQEKSAATNAWTHYSLYRPNNQRVAAGYLDIILSSVYDRNGTDVTANYSPNDATFADLDGDGQLEMIIKRLNTYDAGTDDGAGGTKDIYAYNSTQFVVIDAYDINWLTGTTSMMWRIDCGPNMASMNSTELNVIAYDWDEDGKAEVVLRGADNMIIYGNDGKTQLWTVGNMSVNTRNEMNSHTNSQYAWTRTGAEYLIYMNGLTGAKYQVIDYPLKRLESNETDLNAAWGDNYGHRSTKHFMGAPVLDGRHANLFLGRGIYTRHKMIAMDLNSKTHTWSTRWTWNCNSSNSPWYGNGYHNYIIADVDEDGRDEIVYGSMVIDDNGKGLSTTGYGHGDAQHVSDFNPWRKGLEYFGCLEENPYWGFNYRDATTAEVLFKYSATPSAAAMKENSKAGDDGRCIAGNFMNDYPGSMGRSAGHGMISLTTNADLTDVSNVIGGTECNGRIYWDGDLCSETQDAAGSANGYLTIGKPGVGRFMNLTGTASNNDTKHNSCFQGDIIGDWREEVVGRVDATTVRVFSTGIGTNYSLPCLWYDHQYRQAMVWQMMAYNQPPHLSYFLGELEGYTVAPPPYSMQDRTEIADGGTIGSSHNGKQIIACETKNMSISVEDGASPWVFYDNAPSWVQGTDINGTTGTKVRNTWNGTSGDGSVGARNLPPINYTYYTHTVTGGAFTGKMNLVKQGDGTLVLPTVEQTYTGKTDIWAGTVEFNGSFSKSPVWMNRFTTFNTSGGSFNGGLTMEYAATLNVGGATAQSISSVTVSTLTLNYGSRVVMDVNSTSDASQNDQLFINKLVINTKNWENGPQYSTPVLQINANKALTGGRYPLGTVSILSGDLSKIVIESGKVPTGSYLELDGTTLYLVTGETPILEEPTFAITDMVQNGDYYYPQITVNEGNSGVETTKSFVFTDMNGKETTYANKEASSLFSQDYESETDASSWTTKYATLDFLTDNTNYVQITQGGGSGPRSAYTRFYNTGSDFYGDRTEYVIEFDAFSHYCHGNYTPNAIILYGEGAAMPASNANFDSPNILFQLSGGDSYGTSYTVAGDAKSYNLTDRSWYHYKVEVNRSTGEVKYTITTGSTTVGTGTYTISNSNVDMRVQGVFIATGRAYSYVGIDNIHIYEPATTLGDTFTFTEPGTLKVNLSAEGYDGNSAEYVVPEPYVIKYESPAYNELTAEDMENGVLGPNWNTTSTTTRWSNWSKTNPIYGEAYVCYTNKVNNNSTTMYVDDDQVLYATYLQSTFPLTLMKDFGIGQGKVGAQISANNLGDESTIVYYKAYNGGGNSDTYDSGYTYANSDGSYTYVLAPATNVAPAAFCKLIAYVPESKIVTYEMGDVNMDGSVDISDVVMTVNYILGSSVDNPDVVKYGDMNGDGSIDISDVVAIVNKILN